jgi:hypothetical protein
MASELTCTAILKFDKGSMARTLSVGPVQFDVSGTQYTNIVQAVGTSEEVLAVNDTALGGWLLMINRDTVNYVEWYTGTGGTVTGKLEPGEFALFRTNTTADIYLKANTAGCDVEILLVDD